MITIFKIFKTIKKIRLRNLIILILLLILNTYAWFIYATKVDTNIDVHVSSWNVEFFYNSDESITNMEIDIAKAYPGMDTFTKEIVVHNKGETSATLSYEMTGIRIMNAEISEGDTSSGVTLTSSDLESMISSEFPFVVNIEIQDPNEADSSDVIGRYVITVDWAYESGNDTLDTEFGTMAATYYQTNPTQSFMTLKLRLIASQV